MEKVDAEKTLSAVDRTGYLFAMYRNGDGVSEAKEAGRHLMRAYIRRKHEARTRTAIKGFYSTLRMSVEGTDSRRRADTGGFTTELQRRWGAEWRSGSARTGNAPETEVTTEGQSDVALQ